MVAISKLTQLETTIANGMETFIDVGNALKQIRDERLYREGYETFDEYTKERWGWGKSYANNLIRVSDVDNNLATIVAKEKPKTESQYREVAKAPVEKQAAVVEAANEKAAQEGRTPTAKDFKEAREELCGASKAAEAEIEYEDCGEPEEQPEVVAHDTAAVNAFCKCKNRLATLKQILLTECNEMERQIVKEWLA